MINSMNNSYGLMKILLIGISIIFAGCTPHVHQPSNAMVGMNHQVNPCQFTPKESVNCGRTPTTAMDNNGHLWVAYVVGEYVYVAWSDNMGSKYSDPVKVNLLPEEIYTNGENRAKIAFGKNGEIYVSWTVVREGPFYGDIRFTRSLNGGKNFEPVRTINDDGILTSHRFETLFIDSKGNIYISWLDKRDQEATHDRGEEYNGAALYYTVSKDIGRTFIKNRKVADYSCECCRIAMSETRDGNVAIFWRHIFGDNIRDHGFAVLGLDNIILPVQRATDDNWQIEACPHHGPAMVTASDDSYHVTWFTLGDTRKGIFYGRYDPVSRAMTDMMTVAGAGSSHPYLARSENTLTLVWKQFDGVRTNIMLMQSYNAGKDWQTPESIATTEDASDHPLLLERNGQFWLSWHTSIEGLRVIPLNPQQKLSLQ